MIYAPAPPESKTHTFLKTQYISRNSNGPIIESWGKLAVLSKYVFKLNARETMNE